MTSTIRSYSELITLPTFEERFEYLKLSGRVGESTFGFDRFINQSFYRSKEWRDIRNRVIARDEGCDLADPDHKIYGSILIHHMNPLTVEDIEEGSKYLLDPEYLITTQNLTHNAIHYGDKSLLPKEYIERKPGDTRMW